MKDYGRILIKSGSAYSPMVRVRINGKNFSIPLACYYNETWMRGCVVMNKIISSPFWSRLQEQKENHKLRNQTGGGKYYYFGLSRYALDSCLINSTNTRVSNTKFLRFADDENDNLQWRSESEWIGMLNKDDDYSTLSDSAKAQGAKALCILWGANRTSDKLLNASLFRNGVPKHGIAMKTLNVNFKLPNFIFNTFDDANGNYGWADDKQTLPPITALLGFNKFSVCLCVHL